MSLKYSTYKSILIALLKTHKGNYVTSYQLFGLLKHTDKAMWDDLVNEYSSRKKRQKVGAGAGAYYTPANFISLALDYYRRNGEDSIRKGWFSSTDVIFEGVAPGYPSVVAIWAWKKHKKHSSKT